MKSRLITTVLVWLVTVAWSHPTIAQCTLTVPASTAGPSPVGGMVCPQGDGNPVAQAWLLSTHVIATITAQLKDGNGVPIADFPFQDMWLEFEGFCDCSSNGDAVLADFNTDANGFTTFTAPLSAGSCSTIPEIRLIISGTECATSLYDLGVKFNSVDFDCSGVVDGNDRNELSKAYYKKEYCADLDNDGEWTVDDVIVFAAHRNPSHVCP